MKPFWGWGEKQLPDGTLIVTSPAGCTYVTTPGSALSFPGLCYAVGGMPAVEVDPHPQDHRGERTAMMPRRTRTRALHRAARIAAERRHNHRARTAKPTETTTYPGPTHPPPTTKTPHTSEWREDHGAGYHVGQCSAAWRTRGRRIDAVRRGTPVAQ